MAETTTPAFGSVDEVLLAFQADLPRLFKDKDGQVGNQRTKYADLVQANEVIIPKLNAMGCIWTCAPSLVGNDPGRFVLHYELKHVPSNTSRSGQFPILGDSPMKHGSAITYARRYALLAVTGVIPEDEDEDGREFDGSVSRRPPSGAARAQRPARAAKAQGQTVRRANGGPAPALPGEDDEARGEDVDTVRPGAPGTIDRRQVTRIQTLFGELKYGGDANRDTRLDIMRRILRLDAAPSSTNALSAEQAKTVIDALVARAKQAGAPTPGDGE